MEDCLYAGGRGSGKSDAIIGAWLQHMTQEGKNTRGVIFRRTYPELAELWARMQFIYPATGGIPNKAEYQWTWPAGPTLELRYL